MYLEVRTKNATGDKEEDIPVCLLRSDTKASVAFFLGHVFLFYLLPLVILFILYTIIVRHLIKDSSTSANGSESHQVKTRKKVVLMLLTVVFSFFICLTPFNVLRFYIIVTPLHVPSIEPELYFGIVCFSRIMYYLNSVLNPILYNLMSSKFRRGFLGLCGIVKKRGSESDASATVFKTTLEGTRMSRRAMDSEQSDKFL